MPAVFPPEWQIGSCAVVGASRHLNGLGLGDQIDAHDTVIRFNWHLPSERKGGDHGVRTSIRLMSAGWGIKVLARFLATGVNDYDVNGRVFQQPEVWP